MLYAYFVTSAALILVLNNFFSIMHQSYSLWLCLGLLLGFTLGFIIIQFLILLITVQCISLKSDPDKHSQTIRKMIDATLPLFFTFLRVKIHVSGEEKLPEDNRVMLVCNHTNDIDPAVLIKSFPQLELGFVAKKEAYALHKFIAKAMHKLHCLPLDRENNREGAKTIIKAAKLLKDKTVSIGIFPEGYTSKDGELQPLRNGAFKIATRAGAPIVVCTMVGMRNIHKRLFIKHSDVYLDIADVIYPQEFGEEHTDMIGDRVYKTMKQSIENRRKSIEENKKA